MPSKPESWFIPISGHAIGPLSLEQILSCLALHELDWQDPVFSSKNHVWLPAQEFPEIVSHFQKTQKKPDLVLPTPPYAKKPKKPAATIPVVPPPAEPRIFPMAIDSPLETTAPDLADELSPETIALLNESSTGKRDQENTIAGSSSLELASEKQDVFLHSSDDASVTKSELQSQRNEAEFLNQQSEESFSINDDLSQETRDLLESWRHWNRSEIIDSALKTSKYRGLPQEPSTPLLPSRKPEDAFFQKTDVPRKEGLLSSRKPEPALQVEIKIRLSRVILLLVFISFAALAGFGLWLALKKEPHHFQWIQTPNYLNRYESESSSPLKQPSLPNRD